MRLRFPTKLTLVSAAGGAVFGFGIANALATRTPGLAGAAGPHDDIRLDLLSGVELDGLLGEFEVRRFLDVMTDVEIEELLDEVP